jgi:hypothetical protein
METLVLIAILAFVLLMLSLSDHAGRAHPDSGHEPTHGRPRRAI